MMALKKHPLWNDVKSICDTLRKAGFTAWLAGGCVRDALLGIMPKDFDIVTDASPDQIESLFSKTVDVGKSFGVIRVVREKGDIEIATFRKDSSYSDQRRPDSVEFSTPEEDAKRRDFTINALFYDIDAKKVHDYVGGTNDIKKRVIRTVGDARTRFEEDRLRIFRAVRFVSQLDFKMDPETLKNVSEFSGLLQSVSWERTTDEFNKLFMGRKPQRGVELLLETGILKNLIPEVHLDKKTVKSFSKLPDDTAIRKTVGWILLFSKIDQSQHNQLFKRFKFSNLLSRSIEEALHLADQLLLFKKLDQAQKRRVAASDKVGLALEFLKTTGPVPVQVKTFLAKNKKLPKPLISSAELLKIGMKPGKEFGELLEKAFNAQLNGDFSDRKSALKWLARKN